MAERERPKLTVNNAVVEQQLKQGLIILNAHCSKLIAKENKRLSFHLSLIHDLTSWGGMDKWMTIWSVINNLTDGTEVAKLTEETNPASGFHKNIAAVFSLQKCLEHWLREEVIFNATTLQKASVILENRIAENNSLLKI